MGGGTRGETRADQDPISRSTGMNGKYHPSLAELRVGRLVGRTGCSLVLGRHGEGGRGSDNGQGDMAASEYSPQL